jgi:hypothetical protein
MALKISSSMAALMAAVLWWAWIMSKTRPGLGAGAAEGCSDIGDLQ